MKRRKLRQDGKTVSEIGLGCWSFGGAYGPTTAQDTHKTLAAAIDMGVDFLDTANVYGMGVSESMIGDFLRTTTHRFTIATKAGIWRDPETGIRGFNNTAQYLRTELENSLSRLRLDCMDLFYIHRRDQSVPIEELMGTLLDLKAEGKIAGIGFSEISPATLRRATNVGPVDAVQSEYSLWTRQPELGMIQTCKELDVSFVPFSPLGRGMFATLPPDPSTFEKGHFRTGTPRFTEPNFSHNVRQIEGFKALARDVGTSPISLAVAWCLAKGSHLIPIPGTRYAEHLSECVQGSQFNMTDEIMNQIEEVLPLGWAHGDRYSPEQWPGVEGYC
jgi:aryl-alcohol dehydrogenase-like predicted oxidoreductase